MLKTVLHLVVAAALWFGLGALAVGVPWRLAAVVLGAVAVHFVWERVIFNPYVYLGTMPVADDDPVMQEARERAKETLAVFLEKIFPEHRRDCMVKFPFQTSSGVLENLWADLLEVDGDVLKVFLRTPPAHHDRPVDRNLEVPVNDVLDWQVEFEDGTIGGGYTNRALFTIFEREQGYLHPKLRTQRDRFRDVKEMGEA